MGIAVAPQPVASCRDADARPGHDACRSSRPQVAGEGHVRRRSRHRSNACPRPGLRRASLDRPSSAHRPPDPASLAWSRSRPPVPARGSGHSPARRTPGQRRSGNGAGGCETHRRDPASRTAHRCAPSCRDLRVPPDHPWRHMPPFPQSGPQRRHAPAVHRSTPAPQLAECGRRRIGTKPGFAAESRGPSPHFADTTVRLLPALGHAPARGQLRTRGHQRVRGH